MSQEHQYKIVWKIDPSNYPDDDIERISQEILLKCKEGKRVGFHGHYGSYYVSYMVFPEDKTAEVNYIAKFKFFNWRDNFPEDENILFVNAQHDFANYLALNFHGIAMMGTAIWMMPHSIEKYLKALLVQKKDISINKLRSRNFAHNLTALFERYKAINPESELFHEEDYEILIRELNVDGKNIGIRYSGGIFIDGPFTRIYIEICTILRLDFLGKKKFHDAGPYGINLVPDIIARAYKENRIPINFHDKIFASARD